MKPIPSTLETRRLAVLARAADGLAKPDPYWSPSVLARFKAALDCGPDATPDQLIAVQLAVGRFCDMRLTVDCDGCNRPVERAAIVGEKLDCESSTATLCRACLLEALEALDAAP